MSSASRPARRRRILLPGAALAAVAAILTVSACSGSGQDPSNGVPAGAVNEGAAPSAFDAQGQSPRAGSPGSGSVKNSSLNDINSAAFDRSQIKTARIDLRSGQIANVVSEIEGVAATTGGFIDSEDTATNTHGIATSSSITLRVPVDRFESAVSSVSRLGQLASKKTTTQDVTGQVADVASRVNSARDSIAQLRLLFNRATRLGDIITLESQLSSREADLEALQAQQRALTDQTSLSTISVLVTRPSLPVAKPHQAKTAGFVGGLRQGWDALVTTFVTVAHALGAVLPLGTVVVLLGLLGWISVRRIPRHRPDASG